MNTNSISNGVDEVVKCFFEVLYSRNVQVSVDKIRRIIAEANRFKNKGWRYQDITNAIVEFDQNNEGSDKKINSLTEIDKLTAEEPYINRDGNLLKDKYYYHGRLQRKPEPAKISIDDEGNINKEKESYYLEMIDMFTLQDLNNYFSNKMSIDDDNIADKNYRRFKYLKQEYALDPLLFTIDSAYNYLKEKNYRLINSADKIPDYLHAGYDLYNKAQDAQKGKIEFYYKSYLKERGKRGDG